MPRRSNNEDAISVRPSGNLQAIIINKGLSRDDNKYVCNPRTKTKAGMRTVDVPRVIMDLLATKKSTGKMFATDDGSYLAPNNWIRLFRSWRKQADELITEHNKKNETNLGPVSGLRFHDLRHQFASAMLTLGVQPRITQQMTGHKDLTTLMQRYTHVTPELTKDASEKLNEYLKPPLQYFFAVNWSAIGAIIKKGPKAKCLKATFYIWWG